MGFDARAWAVLAGTAMLGLAGGACAEDWAAAAVATDPHDGVYEIDLSTVSRTGEVAHSWMRHVLPKPVKDPQTGKSYSVVFNERYDDCANRKFSLPSAILRDAKGAVVNQGNLAPGWQPLLPGSVGESVWRVACVATAAVEEKPLLENIVEGQWRPMGVAADKIQSMSVRTDRVTRINKDLIMVASRSDYSPYQWIGGFAVRHVVNVNLIDCRQRKIATIWGDFYISSTLRVKSERQDPKTAQWSDILPGATLFTILPELCTSATPIPKESQQAEAGALSAGTAWATNKGYLVTASHVITGARRITVFNDGEKVGEAKVVVDDPANDVAILKFTAPRPLVILPLAPRPAALGRSVFTLGYPHPDQMGEKVKMTAGQVSSTSGMQDDARFLQISIPTQQGNSGGPVIAWDGTVVGVVDSKLTKFGPDEEEPITPENVNYAVKVSYVRPMLEDLPDLGNYAAIKPGLSNDQLIEQARKAVFMLIVEQAARPER